MGNTYQQHTQYNTLLMIWCHYPYRLLVSGCMLFCSASLALDIMQLFQNLLTMEYTMAVISFIRDCLGSSNSADKYQNYMSIFNQERFYYTDHLGTYRQYDYLDVLRRAYAIILIACWSVAVCSSAVQVWLSILCSYFKIYLLWSILWQ